MNKLLKGFLLGLVATFLVAGSAMALPILTLDDGNGNSVIVDDNGAEDLFSGVDGIIGYAGSVGGWDVTMSMGSSYPVIGQLGFPEMHLSASLTSFAAGTMIFTFTDTFTDWNNELEGLLSGFGGLAGGSVIFRTYLDGVLMADFGPATGAFSDSLISLTTPNDPNDFTISIEGIITHQSGFMASSFDGGVAPVPEPATMLLFGMGLLGLAGITRKRTKA